MFKAKEVSKSVYLSIRNKRTFLYEYFLACGGSPVSEGGFATMFGIWVSQFGLSPDISVRTVVSFLDKKFDYK